MSRYKNVDSILQDLATGPLTTVSTTPTLRSDLSHAFGPSGNGRSKLTVNLRSCKIEESLSALTERYSILANQANQDIEVNADDCSFGLVGNRDWIANQSRLLSNQSSHRPTQVGYPSPLLSIGPERRYTPLPPDQLAWMRKFALSHLNSPRQLPTLPSQSSGGSCGCGYSEGYSDFGEFCIDALVVIVKLSILAFVGLLVVDLIRLVCTGDSVNWRIFHVLADWGELIWR